MGLFDSIGDLFGGGGGIDIGESLGSAGGSYLGNLIVPGAGGVVGKLLGGKLGGMLGGAIGAEDKPDPFMGLNPAYLAATGQAGSLAPLAGLAGMGYGASSEQRQKEMLMSQLRKEIMNKQAGDLFGLKSTQATSGNAPSVAQTENPWIREGLLAGMPNMRWASRLSRTGG